MTMGANCYVYLLVDPADNCVFYVGISINPWNRFYAHCHDRTSAVWDFLGFLTQNCARGRDEILHIYEHCTSRQMALDVERYLIATIPGLMNKPQYIPRRSRA
jgi:hypothetical protein